ncbi:MAG: glycosyltransferase family 1 protein, partial [Gemmatimonadota bacterium]
EKRGIGTVPIPFADRPMIEVVQATAPDIYWSMVPKRSAWCTHHGLGKAPSWLVRVGYESDFHYATDATHYHGLDLLLVRAYSAVGQARFLPGGLDLRRIRWLPFCLSRPASQRLQAAPPLTAHALEQQVRDRTMRIPRAVATGVVAHEVYPRRTAAIKALVAAGLCDVVPGYLPEEAYYDKLRRYQFAITCSSKWSLDVAKHIEIPAAGCVLLTDGLSDGLDYLLPGGSQAQDPPCQYIRYTDGDDVVDIVRELCDWDPLQLIAVASAAQEQVRQRHTFDARVRELGRLLTEIV